MAPMKRKAEEGNDASRKRGVAVSPEQVTSSTEAPVLPFVDESKLTQMEKILRVEVWSEDPNKVANALQNLSDLCYDQETRECNDPNCKQAGETGAGCIVPAVMRKWSENENVVFLCCRALTCCSRVGKKHRDCLICKHAKASGALDAVMWAMQTYSLISSIQVLAIAAVDVLCQRFPTNSHYVVKDMKLLPAVIKSYKEFKDEDMYRDITVHLFDILSDFDELREEMIDAGCISVLDESLRFYKQKGDADDSEKHSACAKATLKKLCSF